MAKLVQLQANAEQAAALLKAMGYSKRLLTPRILNGSLNTSVGELMCTAGLSTSVTSQHLTYMQDEGPIDSRRDTQRILCSIRNETVNAIITILKNVYCPQGATMALTTISPHDA